MFNNGVSNCAYAFIDENGLVVNVGTFIEKDDALANSALGINNATSAIFIPDNTGDNYVGIGWHYIEDTWVRPKPYSSWSLVNKKWTPPVPNPNDGNGPYVWNEETLSWDKHTL
jgi:hypothetical protein